MKRSIKGFYTLEAALFLPVVILAVLSLGFFMKIEGLWENCIHGAIDESSVIASKACNNIEPAMTASKVKQRIREDNPELDSLKLSNVRIMYSDIHSDNLISYRINAYEQINFPLGFEKKFELDSKIKFRGFVGKKERGDPLGASGLQSEQGKDPVWIFPQFGKKYHSENCTYVKAAVHSAILTDGLRKKYDPCVLCKSGNMDSGSIVFCFGNDDTSYHRGTCRCIKRQSAVIDRAEAMKKGYAPCSKCGGG